MFQYLAIQNNAMQAQIDVARRNMGYEVWDDDTGEYHRPFFTTDPFKIIHHPTTDFSAVVIPDKIPYGMKHGEDWARGKPREYNENPVNGRASQDECIDRLWPTNRPLKDEQEMIDDGWDV